jgi:hypothetical protein
MFEDAPVNAGAVQWPDPDSAFWTVRRMQINCTVGRVRITLAGSVTC